MTCATCHPAHHPNDVAIVHRGAVVANVPLVAKEACTGCHRPSDLRDPSARCFDGPTSECFDEHGLKRSSVWPTARDTERQVAVRPSIPVSGAAAPLASIVVAVALLATQKRAKKSSENPSATRLVSRKRFTKALPVIDATRCLGCNACVNACAFDVLQIENFVARVVRPEACCGAVTCAEVCPNGSLTIREEGDPSDALPLSAEGESLVLPGIYVVGDLSGIPLIKNAVAGGARAVRHIASQKKPEAAASEGTLDLVVVGAGAGGLSAALSAKEKGLSFWVIEQSTVAATVQEFPRAKLVFEQPLTVPLEGDLWFKECTKEELIREWTRIVRQEALPIREHERVTHVRRDGDAFLVSSTKADGVIHTHRARHVVLAIGRRGEPRRLSATIMKGAEAMVSYALADAATFRGKSVLVVGLGDSAMEAICALADQPGTDVVAVHRGDTFGRGSARNIEAVQKRVRDGKVRILFQSEVESIEPNLVRLHCHRNGAESESDLKVDAVFALLGGNSPRKWLESIGVWPKSTNKTTSVEIVSEERPSPNPPT